MSLNQLKSRLIHASNTYPAWIGKTLLKGEIGFEELLDTLKISIDKTTIADKIWAIKLTFGEGNIAILANFEKTDETGANWLSSLEDPIDVNAVNAFHYIPVEQDSLNWSGISVDGTFLDEDVTILSTNNGYEVEIIFNNTPHLVEASSQNTKIVITEVTSYVRTDVNAEGVDAEYQHYQFINYRMKVGDGSRTYESLPYFGSVSISTGGGSTSGGTFTGIVYQSELQDFGGSDEELIASITANTTPHNGDLFVVNRRINDQYVSGEESVAAHVEKTAYSYNGTAWIALDGNYDARNVFFHEDITITKPFGIHTTVSSNKVLTAKGKSLYQFLAENLASEDKSVQKTAPKITGSATSNVYIPTTEVAPTTQITFSATSTDPTYDYGVKANDGTIGTFSNFKVTYDGTVANMTNKSYTITATANTTHASTKSYTINADYTEGTEKPLTNLNNVIESQRYGSTTCTTTSAIYARYYTPLIAIKLDTQLTADDLTATALSTIISNNLANAVNVNLGSYASQSTYTAEAQFKSTLPTVINGNNSSYKSIIIAVPTEYNKGLTGKKFAQDSKVPVGASATDVTVTVGSKSYLVTAFTNAATVSFEIIIS